MCQFWLKASNLISHSSASTFLEKKNIVKLCKRGGLHLHKFNSNEEAVLSCLEPSERAASSEHLGLELAPSERALGVQRSIKEDTSNFNISLKDQPVVFVCHHLSLFDPLGFIASNTLSGTASFKSFVIEALDGMTQSQKILRHYNLVG